MTPGIPIAQLLTVEEAMLYFSRVVEAEKVMGPLTREEKLVILKTVGKAIDNEDLTDLLAGKRILHVKGRTNGQHDDK